MTPKSDHEDDMSMEEILASIRKFVTDNPPEDPNKQRVYKGDMSQSVVTPPAGQMVSQLETPIGSPVGIPVTTAIQEERMRVSSHAPAHSSVQSYHPEQDLTTQAVQRQVNGAPVYEPDILELNSPFVSKGAHASSFREASLPSSSARVGRKRDQEESIMTLSNPIDSKMDSSPRFSPKPSQLFDRDREEGLVSAHAMAASASSLSRLAQASKSAPRRASNLADQRDLTIDQLIQDLIRPMIKQWIDTHLSSLVEEMVSKEIKRITKHLG
ncbi:MAG: DUF2497 domain-containing protein [Alphaproteobacteria bacterium]|nr:DUF2497 domain-containing protein [Alphaproteobacteria bacterium]